MRKPNDKCCICDEPFYRRPSVKKKFPNSYCVKHRNQNAAIIRNKKRYDTYIARWKDGLEDGMRGKAAISRYIKRYLLEKSDNSCEKCEWSETNNFSDTLPLEVNHIDGNYLNNLEDNLEVLCPNCHSLTKYYKGANKGRGRPR